MEFFDHTSSEDMAAAARLYDSLGLAGDEGYRNRTIEQIAGALRGRYDDGFRNGEEHLKGEMKPYFDQIAVNTRDLKQIAVDALGRVQTLTQEETQKGKGQKNPVSGVVSESWFC